MTNQTITDRIAQALPQLVHPGDGKNGPIPLPGPMFRTNNIPTEQAKQFAEDAGLPSADIARLYAEAITALIETDHELLPKTDAEQLRADAASGVDRHRQPRIHCHCGQFLFSVNIDSQHPTVNGPELIKALSHMSADCSTKHGAPS